MLKRLIYNLRQRPRESRDRVAFGVAVAFSAIVFMVWVYHAPTKLNAIFDAGNEGVEGQKPFSRVFDKIGDQVSTVKESIEEDAGVDQASNIDLVTDEDIESFMQRNGVSTSSAEENDASVESSASSSSSTTISVSADSSVSSSSAAQPRAIRIVTTKATPTASTTQQ